MRILPGQLNSRLVTNGQIREGASSRKPSGIGWSTPSRATKVRRNAGLVGISSWSMPIRRHRAMAQGFWVMNESGPPSMRKPSR